MLWGIVSGCVGVVAVLVVVRTGLTAGIKVRNHHRRLGFEVEFTFALGFVLRLELDVPSIRNAAGRRWQ